MKYLRASGALRWAPDLMLKRAHFACMMLLHTIGNLGLSPSEAPPLIKSWIRPCSSPSQNHGRTCLASYRALWLLYGRLHFLTSLWIYIIKYHYKDGVAL